MIRHSPSEYYLKYLVVHPDRFDNGQIREIVRGQQLDFIGEPYLERLRVTCVPPVPFYPSDALHRRSQRFLMKEAIRLLFLPDEHMRAANALLGQPRAKELIETLILSGSEPGWICAVLKKKGFSASPEAAKFYKHFYWNIDLVDSTELKAILALRAATDESSDRDVKVLSPVLSKAYYTDPRRMAAYMPISPLSGLMNTMRMGILPTNNELAKIASAARVAATIRTLEAAMNGDPERGRDYAIIASSMNQMMDTIGVPDEDLKEGLTNLVLQTEDAPVPHIHQLSSGQHTVDLQPIGEEKDANTERTG